MYFHVAALVVVCLKSLTTVWADEPFNTFVQENVLFEVRFLSKTNATIRCRALKWRLLGMGSQVVKQNVSFIECFFASPIGALEECTVPVRLFVTFFDCHETKHFWDKFTLFASCS